MLHASRLSGKPDLSLALWKDMAGVARQTSDPTGLLTLYQGMELRGFAQRAAALGLTDGGWRDADLAVISRELEVLDPQEAYRRGISTEHEGVLNRLAEISKNPSVLWPGQPDSTVPAGAQFQEVLRSLSFAFVSDTQVAANAAIVDRRYQLMEDSFNYPDRVYTPPSAEEAAVYKPGQDSLNGDPFSQWHFVFSDRMTLPDQSTAPVREQTSLDLTRIALALETQKRATGSYPDSLDAVAPPPFLAGCPTMWPLGSPTNTRRRPTVSSASGARESTASTMAEIRGKTLSLFYPNAGKSSQTGPQPSTIVHA